MEKNSTNMRIPLGVGFHEAMLTSRRKAETNQQLHIQAGNKEQETDVSICLTC